jgi:hypothetical protein
MKIKYTEWGREQELSVVAFVADKLELGSADGGVIEDLQFTSLSTACAFGRLIQLLAERDQLSITEIGAILDVDIREGELVR